LNAIKRTERGWAGHFILGDRCLFRRNTLLEYDNQKIVVSTVGCCLDYRNEGFTNKREFIEIGYNRYYETMAFHSDLNDTVYFDIDVTKQVDFSSKWSIEEITDTSDLEANQMHEAVVDEISQRLLNGVIFL